MLQERDISLLIDTDDPAAVFNEVRIIVSMMFKDYNFAKIQETFQDIRRLFGGKYPGYKPCNTMYHDLKHTMETLLAMVRLMHGAYVKGVVLGEEYITLGIISALMHDTGYIQRNDDTIGTGGKYTKIHVNRSIDFIKRYFERKRCSSDGYMICKNNILCTGIYPEIDKIEFLTKENKIIGMMLGSADLLGQMSSRTYLEKLPLLYLEFREAQINDYKDELDLLKGTIEFYEKTKRRLKEKFMGVNNYVRYHFKERWNIDRDLYQEAIKKNIAYLKNLLENHPRDYRSYLRRRPTFMT